MLTLGEKKTVVVSSILCFYVEMDMYEDAAWTPVVTRRIQTGDDKHPSAPDATADKLASL